MRRLQFPSLLLRCPSSSSSDELRSSTGESCSPKNEVTEGTCLSTLSEGAAADAALGASASVRSSNLSSKRTASSSCLQAASPRGLLLSDLQPVDDAPSRQVARSFEKPQSPLAVSDSGHDRGDEARLVGSSKASLKESRALAAEALSGGDAAAAPGSSATFLLEGEDDAALCPESPSRRRPVLRRSFSDDALCCREEAFCAESSSAEAARRGEESSAAAAEEERLPSGENAVGSAESLSLGSGCALRLASEPSLSSRRGSCLSEARLGRRPAPDAKAAVAAAASSRCALLSSHERFKRAAVRLAFGVEGVLDAAAGADRLKPLSSARLQQSPLEASASESQLLPPRPVSTPSLGKTLLETKFSLPPTAAAAGGAASGTATHDDESFKNADVDSQERDLAEAGSEAKSGGHGGGGFDSSANCKAFLAKSPRPVRSQSPPESLKCRVATPTPKLRHEDFDWSAAKVLGRGRSSLVYFVRHKASGLPLAVKVRKLPRRTKALASYLVSGFNP